ncbi:MAG: MBL fold metallo-hydrolase [Treponema sp.]|jgi:glyoxylase-like metal-dependent hydrolase (beta-lactamase superfamily II)|nr:MBL fold metallo-hydrolase [Treponema sp.]
MRIFFQYCLPGFTNCYILGSESIPGEAIIVDPGEMGADVLTTIENNEYSLKGVLITHDHKGHVRGLRTLRRIYDVEIYAVNHIVMDYRTNLVRDGDLLNIGPFRTEVISVPGHSSDSAVYKIDNWLFTGDTMSAGLVGTTASSYGAALQMTAIRSKILSLRGDFIVFPGHGPPSTLEAERQFNAGILNYEQNRKRRPSFTLSALNE